MQNNLTVSPGPHISKAMSTRSVMLDVIIALVPAMIMAVVFFRLEAIRLTGVCVITCVLTEWLCNLVRKKPCSLGDLSAILTGLLLALSLPPDLPWWAAVIGSAFAIAIGKMVFGGLGCNIFNPAMVGRAFLTPCFGLLMTTWMMPATVQGISPELIDATTQPTPLAMSKEAIKKEAVSAEDMDKQIKYTFFGATGGCLGETSSLALLIGAAWLFIRKTISWHIPIAILASVFLWAQVGNWMDPSAYASPLIHLTAGGIMLCAFFIATDPVTAPLTKKGMLIFGIGVGSITMLIRMVGEYPEGIMFSILLMNAITPLIDRFTKLVPAGGLPNA